MCDYVIQSVHKAPGATLKAIASSRHGKMKMNEFLIEHLGIQRVVVVILVFVHVNH